jgi:uncharacterized phage-associated protein
MSLIDSIALANYVLLKGGTTSHIKLQKIVYYLEAYHLARFGKPLIDDEFEAWVHGPVSRKLWNAFSKYSVYNPINFDSGKRDEILRSFETALSNEQRDFIDLVITKLKLKSGDQLETLTHSEQPWQEARKGLYPGQPSQKTISKKMMKTFYEQQISAKTQSQVKS